MDLSDLTWGIVDLDLWTCVESFRYFLYHRWYSALTNSKTVRYSALVYLRSSLYTGSSWSTKDQVKIHLVTRRRILMAKRNPATIKACGILQWIAPGVNTRALLDSTTTRTGHLPQQSIRHTSRRWTTRVGLSILSWKICVDNVIL